MSYVSLNSCRSNGKDTPERDGAIGVRRIAAGEGVPTRVNRKANAFVDMYSIGLQVAEILGLLRAPVPQ
jgi:hypothetical protein